jgi:hypothetical protein
VITFFRKKFHKKTFRSNSNIETKGYSRGTTLLDISIGNALLSVLFLTAKTRPGLFSLLQVIQAISAGFSQGSFGKKKGCPRTLQQLSVPSLLSYWSCSLFLTIIHFKI